MRRAIKRAEKYESEPQDLVIFLLSHMHYTQGCASLSVHREMPGAFSQKSRFCAHRYLHLCFGSMAIFCIISYRFHFVGRMIPDETNLETPLCIIKRDRYEDGRNTVARAYKRWRRSKSWFLVQHFSQGRLITRQLMP